MSDTPFTISAGAPSQSEIVPHVRRPVPGTEADSRKLLAYWNALRVNLDVPRRCDVDPRGIAGILSRTFILERVAPGLARFRVAG
ncbi:MAG: PAS domain-containing protein, partial [Pseudomonadota bacterium]